MYKYFVATGRWRAFAGGALIWVAVWIGLVLMLEITAVVGAVDYQQVLGEGNRPRNRHLRGVSAGDIAINYCLADSRYYYNVRYDGHGFRNLQSFSTADVAVIGDSFVEALLVEDSSLFTSRLARRLGKKVANLGLSDTGPHQQLGVLRQFAVVLKPQTVLWVFFEGNDLRDLKRKPEEREGSSTARERSFVLNASQALKSANRRWRERANKKSSTVDIDCVPRASVGKRWALVPVGSEDSVKMYFLYGGHPISEADDAALRELRAVLAQAHATTVENRANLVLVFAPTKFRVYKDIVRVGPASDLANWTINDLPVRLGRLVKGISPDVGFIDLTPTLQAAAKAGILVYRPDDTHWSPDGHRVVAESIAAAMRRN